jgi:DAK2 domain fusion protein YloV
VLESLDAPAVRRWCAACTASLDQHRALLDALNVYPVPDGDTGTNLVHTVRAATEAAAGDPSPSSARAALRAMAHGAVLGARGNSGVIVSQVLRGLAEHPTEPDRFDGRWLQLALKEATDLAYAAVEHPVEGTILTVVRAAADAAQDVLETPPDLDAVVRVALSGAIAALHRTPEMLAELAQAGVVDAGGQGLVLILEALLHVVEDAPPAAGRMSDAVAAAPWAALREGGNRDFGYEVQYLLDAPGRAIPRLRSDLARIGDSLVVVGTGQGTWNVHVHVQDVGAAVEAGVRAGRPYRITVARFDDETEPRLHTQTETDAHPGVSVVAVAPGAGLAHLFEAEGVRVVEGAGGGPPEVADVLAAMRAAGTDRVVLLPNASQITGVAETAAQQARGRGMDVAVVPTKSPVQGLAAVAVHDPERLFGDDVVAMAEAAAATRWAEVTIATHEALTSAGRCQAGDVLGLIDGEVVEIGATVRRVALGILDRLLGVGGEIVTIVLGMQAEPGIAAALRSHVERQAPGTEITVFAGGQSGSPLLIGVE